MPEVGDLVTVRVEKPAAGGWMIARVDGQIVFVSGAIPGESVTARVERTAKGLVYAATETIEDPSPDRRDPAGDPACGGCLYSHIAYERQREIKSAILVDAFARLGRLTLASTPPVAPSREDGYRMRARLHLRRGRLGFFREGSHEICDARQTRQLLSETCDMLEALGAGLRSLGLDNCEIELSENIAATERVVALDSGAASLDARALSRGTAGLAGLTGLVLGGRVLHGGAYVQDRFGVEGREASWRRHVLAFFQGNRYLLPRLVDCVMEQIDSGSFVVDLYAGAGLFSVPAAVARGAQVTAVEGDRAAARDLKWNAEQADPSGEALEPVHQSVEEFCARTSLRPHIVIVDPPRTGISKEAVAGVARLAARRVVYVSCDVATLARDARRLVDAGYAIRSVEAFDMFPNTPHVEAVVVLEKG